MIDQITSEYPIRGNIEITGEGTVTYSFSKSKKYSDDKVVDRGEIFVGVFCDDTIITAGLESEDYVSLCRGVECSQSRDTYTLSSGTGYTDSQTTLRISPSAEGVLLLAKNIDGYFVPDYKCDYEEELFALRVVIKTS